MSQAQLEVVLVPHLGFRLSWVINIRNLLRIALTNLHFKYSWIHSLCYHSSHQTLLLLLFNNSFSYSNNSNNNSFNSSNNSINSSSYSTNSASNSSNSSYSNRNNKSWVKCPLSIKRSGYIVLFLHLLPIFWTGLLLSSTCIKAVQIYLKFSHPWSLPMLSQCNKCTAALWT